MLLEPRRSSNESGCSYICAAEIARSHVIIIMDRRIFLKGALATGALSLASLDRKAIAAGIAAPRVDTPLSKPGKSEQELCDTLIAHAKSLGASYCDVRLVRMLSQSVTARNNVVTGLSDNESYGM